MWQWAVSGKHPSLKEYLSRGRHLPFALALSEWMEKGFANLPPGNRPASGFRSWRFWAGGTGQHALTCGILRDSSDSIGRPYPLLILGTGPLENWHSRWELIPDACENTWNQMEHLSTRLFRDPGDLEASIPRIRPPELDAEMAAVAYSGGQAGLSAGDAPANMAELESEAARKASNREVIVRIREEPKMTTPEMVRLWHFLLKRYLPEIPKMVFMGGNQEATYLVFFRRALSSRDFGDLWADFPSEGPAT